MQPSDPQATATAHDFFDGNYFCFPVQAKYVSEKYLIYIRSGSPDLNFFSLGSAACVLSDPYWCLTPTDFKQRLPNTYGKSTRAASRRYY